MESADKIMKENIYLSVVIPAFNERKRIGKTLERIKEHLSVNLNDDFEIIVVDDGSCDGTADFAKETLSDIKYSSVIQSDSNYGKGHAVRTGVLKANGQYVLFSDADLSTPIEEVDRFLDILQSGYDIVIGSRGLSDSKVKVRQNYLRQLMGKVFNTLARFFSFRGIKDSQCGFKCFRGDIAEHLFSIQKIDGFSFDAEVLYLAQKFGLKVKEEPVIWVNSPESTVSLYSDPLKMIGELFLIKWSHRKQNWKLLTFVNKG